MTKQQEFNDAIVENNFNEIKLLLKEPTINISAHNNAPIQLASQLGYIEIFKMLLNDKRVNPADDNNFAIRIASINKNNDIVLLLLKDKRVKNSLAKNDTVFYDELLKKEIKNKLELFNQ